MIRSVSGDDRYHITQEVEQDLGDAAALTVCTKNDLASSLFEDAPIPKTSTHAAPLFVLLPESVSTARGKVEVAESGRNKARMPLMETSSDRGMKPDTAVCLDSDSAQYKVPKGTSESAPPSMSPPSSATVNPTKSKDRGIVKMLLSLVGTAEDTEEVLERLDDVERHIVHLDHSDMDVLQSLAATHSDARIKGKASGLLKACQVQQMLAKAGTQLTANQVCKEDLPSRPMTGKGGVADEAQSKAKRLVWVDDSGATEPSQLFKDLSYRPELWKCSASGAPNDYSHPIACELTLGIAVVVRSWTKLRP